MREAAVSTSMPAVSRAHRITLGATRIRDEVAIPDLLSAAVLGAMGTN